MLSGSESLTVQQWKLKTLHHNRFCMRHIVQDMNMLFSISSDSIEKSWFLTSCNSAEGTYYSPPVIPFKLFQRTESRITIFGLHTTVAQRAVDSVVLSESLWNQPGTRKVEFLSTHEGDSSSSWCGSDCRTMSGPFCITQREFREQL